MKCYTDCFLNNIIWSSFNICTIDVLDKLPDQIFQLGYCVHKSHNH